MSFLNITAFAYWLAYSVRYLKPVLAVFHSEAIHAGYVFIFRPRVRKADPARRWVPNANLGAAASVLRGRRLVSHPR